MHDVYSFHINLILVKIYNSILWVNSVLDWADKTSQA